MIHYTPVKTVGCFSFSETHLSIHHVPGLRISRVFKRLVAYHYDDKHFSIFTSRLMVAVEIEAGIISISHYCQLQSGTGFIIKLTNHLTKEAESTAGMSYRPTLDNEQCPA
jgi:hypothetical protein